MRVLIATDGSTHAQRAVALVAAQAWPEGTELRVVVVDDGRSIAHLVVPGTPIVAGIPGPGGLEAGLAGEGPEDLAVLAERAAAALEGPGRSVSSDVLMGRPASVIVEEGKRIDADLIVLGSRGHGRLGSLALGSVSAEVVDHANRPVLVARSDARIQRVVLADDGSDPAAKARRAVAEWPIFADAEVTIVSVAHVSAPIRSAIAPTMYRAALADYEQSLEDARAARDQVLRAASMELQVTGRRTTTVAADGDPATQILAAAKDSKADLVVMGSRGHTGLTRLLLGSVARNVLYEAPCSVLVVR